MRPERGRTRRCLLSSGQDEGDGADAYGQEEQCLACEHDAVEDGCIGGLGDFAGGNEQLERERRHQKWNQDLALVGKAVSTGVHIDDKDGEHQRGNAEEHKEHAHNVVHGPALDADLQGRQRDAIRVVRAGVEALDDPLVEVLGGLREVAGPEDEGAVPVLGPRHREVDGQPLRVEGEAPEVEVDLQTGVVAAGNHDLAAGRVHDVANRALLQRELHLVVHVDLREVEGLQLLERQARARGQALRAGVEPLEVDAELALEGGRERVHVVDQPDVRDDRHGPHGCLARGLGGGPPGAAELQARLQGIHLLLRLGRKVGRGCRAGRIRALLLRPLQCLADSRALAQHVQHEGHIAEHPHRGQQHQKDSVKHLGQIKIQPAREGVEHHDGEH
mmetsp:Transcript_78884/g.223070  ORF Transcript_78884/g.223070 Transcript_78884/m.223070 type:complete len:389 (+) Transcript_78884:1254-2420(+)